MADEPVIEAKPGEWDARVAWIAGTAAGVLWAATAWPLVWRLVDALRDNAQADDVLGFELALLGTVALFAGAYLAVLELRARTRRTLTVIGGREEKALTPDLAKEIGEALGKALDAFGKLTASSALLVVSLGLFAGAAALVWS